MLILEEAFESCIESGLNVAGSGIVLFAKMSAEPYPRRHSIVPLEPGNGIFCGVKSRGDAAGFPISL